MENTLGTVRVSSDILKNADIGLWAIEFDEGHAPRMYADDTMLGLIGFDRQMSPVDIYRDWSDDLDTDSRAIVTACIEKMKNGERAEAEYPRQNADGNMVMVHISGTTNRSYASGIRVEGIYQESSTTSDFQKEELERIRKTLVGRWVLEKDEFFISSQPKPVFSYKADVPCYIHFRDDLSFTVKGKLKGKDRGIIFRGNCTLSDDGSFTYEEWINGIYKRSMPRRIVILNDDQLVYRSNQKDFSDPFSTYPEDAERCCDYGLSFYKRVP